MRAFLISTISILLLVGIWIGYDHYSDDKLQGYIEEVRYSILPDVEDDFWEGASEKFDALSQDWHEYKKSAAFFYDTDLLNEVDYTVAKAKYYIKAADISNASGELSSLIEQFTFLHFNESLRPENIF